MSFVRSHLRNGDPTGVDDRVRSAGHQQWGHAPKQPRARSTPRPRTRRVGRWRSCGATPSIVG